MRNTCTFCFSEAVRERILNKNETTAIRQTNPDVEIIAGWNKMCETCIQEYSWLTGQLRNLAPRFSIDQINTSGIAVSGALPLPDHKKRGLSG
jgi:hypothetical protein